MNLKYLSVLLILCSFLSVNNSFPQEITILKCGKMIDVVNEDILYNTEIAIQNNIIIQIGTQIKHPKNSKIIDLSNMVVLPGLIDAHVHICIEPAYFDRDPVLYESIPYRTIQAGAASLKHLNAGFTTLRDVGCEGAFLADIAVKDAINNGIIIGPRLQVASLALTILGGYEDSRGYAQELNLPAPGVVVNSKAEMIQEVRRQAKYGADLIKIYATGSVSDISKESFEPLNQLKLEEVKIIVEEAERLGKFVSAHAYGGEGAKSAILGGVRSIEHGILLNNEHLDLMKKNDVFWCPTLNVYKSIEGLTSDNDFLNRLLNNHKNVFKKALEKGIKIAFGTDTGAMAHGKNAEEFVTMVEYGMSPMQSIKSATIIAAELMGWDNKIGSLERGKYADIIAVADNPLTDISTLKNVKFVMKDGVIIKNNTN